VVQRHGGELQIQSEPAKGSRFRMILPAIRVRQASEVSLGVESAMMHAVDVF
jgi:two-component system phosphate regulon sensor histidine kinase PhoR